LLVELFDCFVSSYLLRVDEQHKNNQEELELKQQLCVIQSFVPVSRQNILLNITFLLKHYYEEFS